jgi:cytochrome c-type biogenesis protein CcsB
MTLLSIVILAAVAAVSCGSGATEAQIPLSVGRSFTESVELEHIRLTAVLDGGRLKTFDSLAREKLKWVHGARAMRSVDPVLMYFDMMFVPQLHAGANEIFIKKKPVRQQIVQMVRAALPPAERQGVVSEAELARIVETGMVSTLFLDHPAVRAALEMLERDLISASKQVDDINAARALSDPRNLAAMWAAVPPPGGDPLDPWFSISSVASAGAPADAAHAGVAGGIPGIDPGRATRIADAWSRLGEGWRFQDAAVVNGALQVLVDELPQVEPALYPSPQRLDWEHWYYRNNKLTATWIVYFLAIPFLLISMVYGFRWSRIAGLALFAFAFLVHTLSIGLRWYLAGRIPNANMFEAITAAAWFGVLVAIVLEVILRRWPLKNLPAIAASAGAMTALMVGHFLPITLNNDISPVMPVLDRTIWLYIHTNIVIASYALIFFASVTGLMYLGLWCVRQYAPSSALGMSFAGPDGVAGLSGGGAASLILGRGVKPGEDPNRGLAKVLDGTTMIFLELAFISLWFGTILGAAWADVSWGRPWGWDPKEVFALNTWIVFLVLVHVRLKVKDKGFWTAILAVIGCLVMLFNWIVVNFVIVGLHSYA